MYNQILSYELYLVANLFLSLALLAHAWLYFDLYKKEHQSHVFFVGFGSMLLGFSYIYKIIFINTQLNNELLIHTLQLIGLGCIFYGYMKEIIPGMPTQKKGAKFYGLSPAILLMSLIGKFVLGLLITLRVRYKVKFGLSKQFTLNYYFWFIMSLLFLGDFFILLGKYYNPVFERIWEFGTPIWLLYNSLTLAAAFLLFHWIGNFIAFRIFAKIFLSIWRLIIVTNVFLACIFAIISIRYSEKQIYELLHKATNLVAFNIDQIQDYNLDLLEILSTDLGIKFGINNNTSEVIQNELRLVSQNNRNLDQIVVTDQNALVVFDSLIAENKGTSISGNSLIQRAIVDKTPQAGYVVVGDATSNGKLVFQVTYPIVNEQQEIIGSASAYKYIDDAYLDLLKAQTGQEALVYIDNYRVASTVVELDGLSRLENLPFNSPTARSDKNNIRIGQVQIMEVPYYTSSLIAKDYANKQEIELIFATKQALLLQTTERSLSNTFIVTLLLCLWATLPTYLLAESLKRNISA